MIALGIVKPEFNKRGDIYLVGLTKYALGGDSRVPNLDWYGGERLLGGVGWGGGWDGDCRFVCVSK